MPTLAEKPDTNPSIYLHAELLPNIRHITLYISLPTHLDTDISPIITLSESRRAVSVSLPEPFDHVTDTIKLPARVNEASRRILNTRQAASPQDRRREYSFRMQIDSADETPLPAAGLVDDFVPWTAADMSRSSRLRCRRCASIILDTPAPALSGWVWKDLPSGNWAEMMDFWHCHKPEPEEADGEDRSALTKGYGAANQVVATRGTVLVDVASFLVSDGDCRGLKKDQQPDESSKESASLTCENCNSIIGAEDPVAHGWRLFKISLSASTPTSTWHTHSTESIISAQLLELVERESARRFAIHSNNHRGFLVWVFNPDFRYSNSSSGESVAAQRALKVLFQTITDVDSFLTGRGATIEEVRVPGDVFGELERVLEMRNGMLPVSARVFREWRVGVLHRFERGDCIEL